MVSPAERVDGGIAFALAIEAGRFADRVEGVTTFEAAGVVVHQGLVAGRRIAWVATGAGIDHAARACRLLIEGHRPRIVFAAGFAGGLSPALPRGVVVRPRRVVRPGTGSIDLAADPRDAEARPLTIATVDRVVCTPADKQRLALETSADAVDLETWGVAAAARAAGVECRCLKVISDSAADPLPPEVAALTGAASPWRRLGIALRTVGRRPAAAADLWRLWERAVLDSRLLADDLVAAITVLPARPG